MAEKNVQNDFSKGNIPAVVMRMALPLIAAQLVNVLYNVVDRIYIGHIPNVGSMALTGVGIALPVISILSAFAGLFGQGGAPLCSMARGRGDNDEASRVMGNAFSMLLVSSVALGLLTWAFLDPVITVFAAGKEASSYAREYLAVYLIGTTFSFVSLGMNVYINAQGFATRGMLTVLLGAAANIVLDPLFIFAFRMGVRGAAAATVLSQALSAAWCFLFLRSSKTPLELSWRTMAPRKKIMGRIVLSRRSRFRDGRDELRHSDRGEPPAWAVRRRSLCRRDHGRKLAADDLHRDHPRLRLRHPAGARFQLRRGAEKARAGDDPVQHARRGGVFAARVGGVHALPRTAHPHLYAG